jgi:hypothetical protein
MRLLKRDVRGRRREFRSVEKLLDEESDVEGFAESSKKKVFDGCSAIGELAEAAGAHGAFEKGGAVMSTPQKSKGTPAPLTAEALEGLETGSTASTGSAVTSGIAGGACPHGWEGLSMSDAKIRVQAWVTHATLKLEKKKLGDFQ